MGVALQLSEGYSFTHPGINYQAVARNAEGFVLAGQDIDLRISLLAGSPKGEVMYSEVHKATTKQETTGNWLAMPP